MRTKTSDLENILMTKQWFVPMFRCPDQANANEFAIVSCFYPQLSGDKNTTTSLFRIRLN